MKIIMPKHFIAISLFLYLIVGCTETPQETNTTSPEDAFAGKYTLNKSTLIADVSTLKKDADMTEIIKNSFFSIHTCTDTKNLAAMELKNDRKLFFFCEGENNSKQYGTWAARKDGTGFSLNLAGVPCVGTFSLNIENITRNANIIIGDPDQALPVPTWLVTGAAQPTDPCDLSNPANHPISLMVNLEFKKL